MERATGNRLSRERIVEVALELAAHEGIDAISMRRLAQQLGVWPMSVDRHFRDKEDLLDAVVGSAAGEIPLPDGSRPWRTELRDLLSGARDALGRAQNGLGGRVGPALLTPGLLRFSEAGLRTLRRAGLDAAAAAGAWRALCSYTFGFDAAGLGEPEPEARRRVRAAIAALPEAEFPALAEAANELAAALAREDEFGAGLELLLDGLEARLESDIRAHPAEPGASG
jgi:AcrR family transcriptional regulator